MHSELQNRLERGILEEKLLKEMDVVFFLDNKQMTVILIVTWALTLG